MPAAVRTSRAKSASSKAKKTPAKSTAKTKSTKTAKASASSKAKAKSKAAAPAKNRVAATKSPAKAKTAKAAAKPVAKKPATKARGEIGGPNEQLWRDYKATRDPALRNQLMEMYLSVVDFIAERLLMTLPRSIELDDLKSAGMFGLMDAIDGFDLDRGIKFKTYCSTRVRGAILDELRSQDWVPRLVRLRAHQIARAQAALEARHGRAPTHAEMAGEMDVSLGDYMSMMEEARAHTVRSLQETWDDGNGDQSAEKIDFLRDPGSPDPADVLNQEDVMRAIIRSLNRREKQIILMYYRDGLTMKQIGEVLQLTESRVCQIHSNVMRKLKNHLETAQLHLWL